MSDNQGLADQQSQNQLELMGKLDAINKVQAIIEFNLDGTIITANENFTNTVGYSLDEIRGKHHRMFCEESYAKSEDYKTFWQKLNRGEFEAGEFKRFGKNGNEVWIQASYNPIFDADGKPFKVVKFATDITDQKLKAAENDGKMAAIDKSQAVIEFNLDGTIITANENFTNTVGYSLDEIKGKHHRIFCEKNYASSPDYKAFWQKLNRGEYDAGEYKRLGKEGKEIWIQASYNPIFDADGKPFKVVKFATDISAVKKLTFDVVGISNNLIENVKSISVEADNLSEGASTQSSTIEQMSASIEELTSSIQNISHNSQDADKIATQAAQEAEQGKEAVERSVQAMELINKSSEQISEIIKVISEIASQTNLLALNAAIEAARAGEHGLGFAVVADEVRKLAERSSEAAKEISELIKESTQRVTQGSELSQQTGEALKKIVEGVEKTASSIAQIATAAEEQSSTADEVNKGIQHVSQVTEQAAAATEEMATSCDQLSHQADELKNKVAAF